MSDVVVDANIVVKWVIDQTYSDRARQLFEDTIRARSHLVAPALLPAEVINTIHQHHRSQDPKWHISDAEATAALQAYLAFPIVLLTPATLYERAFDFARAHRLNTTYDAIYVVLANLLGIEMWTGDQALLRAVGAVVPWVRPIAEYPLPAAG